MNRQPLRQPRPGIRIGLGCAVSADGAPAGQASCGCCGCEGAYRCCLRLTGVLLAARCCWGAVLLFRLRLVLLLGLLVLLVLLLRCAAAGGRRCGRRRSGSSLGVEVLRPGSARCGRGPRAAGSARGAAARAGCRRSGLPWRLGSAASGGSTAWGRLRAAPVRAAARWSRALRVVRGPHALCGSTWVGSAEPRRSVGHRGRRRVGREQRAHAERRRRPAAAVACTPTPSATTRRPRARFSALGRSSGSLRRQRSMTVHSGSGTVVGRRGSSFRCAVQHLQRGARRRTAGGR